MALRGIIATQHGIELRTDANYFRVGINNFKELLDAINISLELNEAESSELRAITVED